MTAPSLEAQELAAQRALAAEARLLRDRQVGRRSTVTGFPETKHLAAASQKALAVDPARAAYFAEAFLAGHLRRVVAAHDDAVAATSVQLQGSPPLPIESLRSALATEPNRARREALSAKADVDVVSLRDVSRAVVDATREGLAALDPSLVSALGLGDASAEAAAVLDATQSLWEELDPWALRARELDPTRASWADREHALMAPAVTRAVPPPTWSDLGARVFERVGLGDALRRVVSELRPATVTGTGVYAVVSEPGARAMLLGRPTVAGRGAGEVMGAVARCAAGVIEGVGTHGQVRGKDRALDGAFDALGRRLLLEPVFVTREAGVGADRERVLLEALHAELRRTRWDAAMALFAASALRREPGMAERFTELCVRAVGAAPSPAWAAVVVARAAGHGGPWGARWAALTRGALYEAVLSASLREAHDEDWFRNPSAGETLAGRLREARALGVELDAAAAGEALRARCAGWMDAARRG